MLVKYKDGQIKEKKIRDLANGALFRAVEHLHYSAEEYPPVYIKIARSLEIIETIHNSNSGTSISSTLTKLCDNDFLVFNTKSQTYHIVSDDCYVYELVGELIVDYKR